MNFFSQRSYENLMTCDYNLQVLFFWVLKEIDCTVICGYRGKEAQEKAVKDKTSHAKYPKSKHNVLPSLAVDVVAYPIEWDNFEKNAYFAGFVVATAQRLGIALKWGHDWNRDHVPDKHGFIDVPHYELVKTNGLGYLGGRKIKLFT